MVFNPQTKLGSVYGGYQLSDGDFHLTRSASHKNDFTLFSESYQFIKGIYFYGKLEYHNSNEKGNLWVGVYDPQRETPYVIGDSIPGANYHKENFQLSGGVATYISDNISVGILAEYFAGVAAKQKDPRPKNTVTDFSLNPSLILHFRSSKLGINLGYRNRKEDISYKQTITNEDDPTYFMFKGLGFYSSGVGQNKDRFQFLNNYSAGVQFETTFMKFRSLTEICGNYSLEETEDGSSTIKKSDAGDWKTYKAGLKQQFIKENKLNIQKISFNGSYFNGDGIEYEQKQITNEDKISEYITLAKNLKFNRKTYSGNIRFDYLKLCKDEKISWEGSVYAGINVNQEKYYFIPEVFNADYSNLEAGINYSRNFYLKNFHFAPEISIRYQSNLSNKLNLPQNLQLANGKTTEDINNKKLFINDFNYLTSDNMKVSLLANCGFDMPQINYIDELFIKIGYDRWEEINLNKSQNIITAKIGFIF